MPNRRPPMLLILLMLFITTLAIGCGDFGGTTVHDSSASERPEREREILMPVVRIPEEATATREATAMQTEALTREATAMQTEAILRPHLPLNRGTRWS